MHLARRLHWLRKVALLGSLLALFLTYAYVTGKGSLCTLGDYFVCTLSETSYATVDGIYQFFSLTLGNTLPSTSVGIPNSFIFLLGFLVLFFLSYRLTPSALSGLKVTFYILAAYSVFLTYAETYVLYTLSLLGIVMSVLVFVSLWLLVGLHTDSSSGKRLSKKSKHSKS
ncbi:MAG: hypothetical protein Q8L34_01970 [Candidatus Woesearchaeota archaeon]|nr:hypothetical protein [Candidatus Woesearchaeota archaeon]